MRLYLAFLVAAFVLGGTSTGRAMIRRPLGVLVGCMLVGAMFYSYRFIQ